MIANDFIIVLHIDIAFYYWTPLPPFTILGQFYPSQALRLKAIKITVTTILLLIILLLLIFIITLIIIITVLLFQ